MADKKFVFPQQLMKLNPILLIVLMVFLAVAMLLQSKDGVLIIIVILFLYVGHIGLRKLEITVQGLQRRRQLQQMPVFSLQGTMLVMTGKNTSPQRKSLDDLERVQIITTDQGPFVCDIFLVLAFHDGTKWSVPMENPSYQNFYDALGKCLPLNGEQALLAALSIDNITFSLWEREKAQEETPAQP